VATRVGDVEEVAERIGALRAEGTELEARVVRARGGAPDPARVRAQAETLAAEPPTRGKLPPIEREPGPT